MVSHLDCRAAATPAAARELGFSGVTRVNLEVVKQDMD
jgi:hypothetical protein